MKFLGRILIFVCFFLLITNVAYASNIPNYVRYVNDTENILDNDVELEKILSDFEKKSTVEIAILTVPDFQDSTIEDYAVKVFESWKIGKKENDNGLLIIVSKQQRKARIEVGYGLEGTLPDSLTYNIQQDYMIPSFKEDNYSEGVLNGINALIGVIDKDPTVIASLEKKNSPKFFEGLISIIFILIYVMAGTKSWWLGGVFGAIVGLYIGIMYQFYFAILFTVPLGLVLDYILSKTVIGRAVMRGGNLVSSVSGSRSSSGGVSFGGGSSGGGGSSSSW